MKLIRSLIAAASAASAIAAFAAVNPSPSTEAIAMPSITVGTTVADLAKGYAEASRQLSESRIVLYYKSDDKPVALRGIRSVRAFGGVLLVNLSAGESIIISAERVLLITDGGRTP